MLGMEQKWDKTHSDWLPMTHESSSSGAVACKPRCQKFRKVHWHLCKGSGDDHLRATHRAFTSISSGATDGSYSSMVNVHLQVPDAIWPIFRRYASGCDSSQRTQEWVTLSPAIDGWTFLADIELRPVGCDSSGLGLDASTS